MPDLSVAEGRTYGPFPLTLTAERVGAFVEATRDDPQRWTQAAPPGFAAATLFLPAPAFFADPDVAPHAGSIIHADQSFTWHAPWTIGGEYSITGVVGRIRTRGGIAFVGFTMAVDRHDERVLDAAATFLMSGDAPPAGATAPRDEPPALMCGTNDPLPPVDPERVRTLRRSASRADLVRYAAATTDFNPIHWDHDAATAAGLPGVVCHGLLLASWMFQSASRLRPGDRPLAEAKVRFKAPVLAAAACEISGTVADDTADLSLTAEGTECVTGRVVVTP